MRICVFCGSQLGTKPSYAAAAKALGAELAARNIGLVYGGGKVGLMGTIADAVLAAGGEVQGVIPGGLAAKEIAHDRVTQLHVVETMHQRKALMEQLSDAFIAMPGGFGTLEEILEIITWTQLGLHRKPAGFLNVDGYYDSLLAQFRRSVDEGFAPRAISEGIVVDANPPELVSRIVAHQPPPPTVKWIRRSET